MPDAQRACDRRQGRHRRGDLLDKRRRLIDARFHFCEPALTPTRVRGRTSITGASRGFVRTNIPGCKERALRRVSFARHLRIRQGHFAPAWSPVIRTKALFESLWTSPKKILAYGGGLVGHASIASRASMITWCAQTVAVTRRGGCTSARSRPISSAISTWIHRSGMHILAEHLTGKSPTLLSTRR
jgi:hypothetical protein